MTTTVERALSVTEETLMFAHERSTAIEMFVHIEQMLAALMSAGVDLQAATALGSAFFGIESFRGKLEFADRFVQHKVQHQPELLALWEGARKACQAANAGRIKVVHYGQTHYVGGRPRSSRPACSSTCEAVAAQ